jgi:hypothetical protein
MLYHPTIVAAVFFNVPDDVFDFEDHPDYLQNPVCVTFWYLSKNVRAVLNSPAWKDRVMSGTTPFFCLKNGFCRYFEDRATLNTHLQKKPDHIITNYFEWQLESDRRVQLRKLRAAPPPAGGGPASSSSVGGGRQQQPRQQPQQQPPRQQPPRQQHQRSRSPPEVRRSKSKSPTPSSSGSNNSSYPRRSRSPSPPPPPSRSTTKAVTPRPMLQKKRCKFFFKFFFFFFTRFE